MDVKEEIVSILENMPSAFNRDAAGSVAAAIRFVIEDVPEACALLTIADGACTLEFTAGSPEEADLTIMTPAQVWIDIVKGKLDGMDAFMGGKYKVDGDVNLLLSLGDLFSSMVE